MNFEMQELVGKWCFLKDGYYLDGAIGRITNIDLASNMTLYSDKGWTPSYPIKIALLVNLAGHCRWINHSRTTYLRDIETITPEVAQIYMQANGLYDPSERKPNENKERRDSNTKY